MTDVAKRFECGTVEAGKDETTTHIQFTILPAVDGGPEAEDLFVVLAFELKDQASTIHTGDVSSLVDISHGLDSGEEVDYENCGDGSWEPVGECPQQSAAQNLFSTPTSASVFGLALIALGCGIGYIIHFLQLKPAADREIQRHFALVSNRASRSNLSLTTTLPFSQRAPEVELTATQRSA